MKTRRLYAMPCVFTEAKGHPVPSEMDWSRVTARKRCTKHCPYWKLGGLCALLGGKRRPKTVELVVTGTVTVVDEKGVEIDA